MTLAGLGGLVLSLLTAPEVAAQEDVSQQLWLDYNPSVQPAARLQLYGVAGARVKLESGGWRRAVIQPNLRYSLPGSARISGGVGSFYTFNDTSPDRWELRPWQGVSIVWPRTPISIEHYVRFEERIEYATDTWESRVSLRARYRVRASVQWAALSDGRYWRLLASAEGLKKMTGEEGQFREQARVSLGLERSFGRGLRTRAEATWQRQGRLFSRGPVSELFLRLRLYQRWGQ